MTVQRKKHNLNLFLSDELFYSIPFYRTGVKRVVMNVNLLRRAIDAHVT